MKLRKFLSEQITNSARTYGYEIIPGWRVSSFPLIDHLRTLFRQYQIDYVIDVGGNLGQYHDMIRHEVGFPGQILTFEPVRHFVDILREKSRGDPAWQIHDCALGSSAGEATINVTKSPGLNSILQPRTDVVAGFWKEDSITRVEKIRVRTLDDVLEERDVDGKKHKIYLKLDTQGFDLEVLKGGVKSVPDVCALQTEASIRPIYESMPNYVESLEYLSRIGFDVSGMFPVTHDSALRLIEFDCIFVNNRIANRLADDK